MKRFRPPSLIAVAALAALAVPGAARAQWWVGTMPPPPPTPPSSGGRSDTGGRAPVYRPAPASSSSSASSSDVHEPTPLTARELREEEAERVKQAAEVRQLQGELQRVSARMSLNMNPGAGFRLSPSYNISFVGEGAADTPPWNVMVARIGELRTPADRIPTQNLRRATAILAPLLNGLAAANSGGYSEEDVAYLADQAAQAMEGAELSVLVTDQAAGGEARTQSLVQKSQDIVGAQADLQQLQADRLSAERDLVEIGRQIGAAQGDRGALEAKRDEILRTYKSSFTAESAKRDAIKAMTGGVQTIWVN